MTFSLELIDRSIYERSIQLSLKIASSLINCSIIFYSLLCDQLSSSNFRCELRNLFFSSIVPSVLRYITALWYSAGKYRGSWRRRTWQKRGPPGGQKKRRGPMQREERSKVLTAFRGGAWRWRGRSEWGSRSVMYRRNSKVRSYGLGTWEETCVSRRFPLFCFQPRFSADGFLSDLLHVVNVIVYIEAQYLRLWYCMLYIN